MNNSHLVKARGGPRRQAGASMIEFALLAPFAVLAVLTIIQLGMMYSAQEVVNTSTFMAARAGSVENAQLDKITQEMTKGLIPLYQGNTTGSAYTRLPLALLAAKADTACEPPRCFLKIEILNPTPEAFEDFGLTSSIGGQHTYIPNDNLEWRSHDVIGPKSKLSIQDANALKIKVTYGYPIKVPLMARVIPAILCFQHVGLDAFDRDATQPDTPFDNCTNYYLQGRIPIVSYATVQMQTPAWQPEQQNQ